MKAKTSKPLKRAAGAARAAAFRQCARRADGPRATTSATGACSCCSPPSLPAR